MSAEILLDEEDLVHERIGSSILLDDATICTIVMRNCTTRFESCTSVGFCWKILLLVWRTK